MAGKHWNDVADFNVGVTKTAAKAVAKPIKAGKSTFDKHLSHEARDARKYVKGQGTTTSGTSSGVGAKVSGQSSSSTLSHSSQSDLAQRANNGAAGQRPSQTMGRDNASTPIRERNTVGAGTNRQVANMPHEPKRPAAGSTSSKLASNYADKMGISKDRRYETVDYNKIREQSMNFKSKGAGTYDYNSDFRVKIDADGWATVTHKESGHQMKTNINTGGNHAFMGNGVDDPDMVNPQLKSTLSGILDSFR